MDDKWGMDRENGMFGLIGLRSTRFPVDGWELHRPTHTAMVFCDVKRFSHTFNLTDESLTSVVGIDWQVRCDNEERLYYGYAKCIGLSRSERVDARNESLAKDLVLHFEFHHRSYGPYHVAEAKAMARNGNSLFFDLLSLFEIDHRIAVGDVRFKYKSAYTA